MTGVALFCSEIIKNFFKTIDTPIWKWYDDSKAPASIYFQHPKEKA